MAARGTDPSGRVTGIDFSGSMLDRAERAPQETGLTNVEFHGSPAERLPVKDGEVDVVIVNGIFNLNPNRGAIFSELAGGVVRQNGHVHAAEPILIKPATNSPSPAEADRLA